MDEILALQAQIAAMTQQISALIAAKTGESTHTDSDDNESTEEYIRGYEEGIEYGEARAYADSLSIAIDPNDSLVAILEKVATKVTGSVVKKGEPPAFYKGLIAGKVSVFSDSKRINPTEKVNGAKTAAQKAEEARQLLIKKRYPDKSVEASA